MNLETTNKQVFNPYLPSYEYIPDGEPYVFDGRLYVFGSHDKFNGKQFCLNDYVLWSAPVENLSDWQYEGVIYKKSQDPLAKEDSIMQAPDVCRGPDGRYYLYYTLGLVPVMSVAVSEHITGPYEYYGIVKDAEGNAIGTRDKKKRDLFQFDPGVFRDENGRIYLYSGFGPEETGIFESACKEYLLDGCYVMELDEDMLTAKTEPKKILPKTGYAQGTSFEGHEFFEASSMRKINGIYYLIYSSILGHELCYAISSHPDQGFEFGGTLVSNGNIGFQGQIMPSNYTGNTHGSIVCVKNQWYVFYHRQTNRHQYSRQGCAEKICIGEDGHIKQAEMTSCGLNHGPLAGTGKYPSHICCELMGKNGAAVYGLSESPDLEGHPYLTQSGVDREKNGDQYIANLRDGSMAGYKYFEIKHLSAIEIEISGEGNGRMEVLLGDQGKSAAHAIKIGEIEVKETAARRWYKNNLVLPMSGIKSIYFRYKGTGFVNLYSFELFN